MRVMVDTNIVISALIFNSPTILATISLASIDSNTLLISTFTLAEARAVVGRKWPKRIESLEQ